MAIVTLLAAMLSTDSESGCLDPSEALHQHLPLYSRLAVTRLLNMEDRCCSHRSSMRLELCQHSSGIYMVVSPRTRTDIPHTDFSQTFQDCMLMHAEIK
jgi:hypothetical protein